MNFSALAPYWDVKPDLVRTPFGGGDSARSLPLSILGDPGGELYFESSDRMVAQVIDGSLEYGLNPGAAVVTVESMREGMAASRRYVQVEIFTPDQDGGEEGWTASGYVERLGEETWHFYYFSDWYDEYGSNVRVSGELSRPVFLDKDYLLVFDVWGEIESSAPATYDLLEFYVGNDYIKQFNPDEGSGGEPLEPYLIPRRVEHIDLSAFTGRSVTLRFVWDTLDEGFQKFDGWFVSNLEMIPITGE